MPDKSEIVVSPRASERIAAARAWLELQPRASEVLVIASVPEAADDLVRDFAIAHGSMLGVHRLTLNRLVGLLAADRMAEAGLAPADGLAAEAVATRAVFRLASSKADSYFEPVLERPGFPRALARTLAELRLNNVTAEQLRALDSAGESLAAMLERFDAELAAAKLIDRAAMLQIAADAVRADLIPRFAGLPMLLLDPSIDGALERDLLAALAARSPSILATAPTGDTHVISLLEQALGTAAKTVATKSSDDGGATSLARLQSHLFGDSPVPERDVDDTVAMISAAGEMHECVEIARRICAEARRGVRFDRIAVLLHEPVRYAPYLQEALARAEIPAYFARGTRRPEPGGRALLALLSCASEDLSASRFAEYLSLAQVPDADASPSNSTIASPDSELAPAPLADDLEIENDQPESEPESSDPIPVVAGTVRAPWRWERLIVDAAVIGSAERWERRLGGLRNELLARRAEYEDDDTHVAGLERRILDLDHLTKVAMPILNRLGARPISTTWGEWLQYLRDLVALAIRDAEPVLAALGELEPMAPVGPIGLDEVRMVLGVRLGRLETPRRKRRHGAVFVASPWRAKGMAFDVVIAPGLAERVFPRKLIEDPLLPDSMRARLSPMLARVERRSSAERLALRIAAGAARERAIFSYPRVDLDQGRPRVPSFYALEILRAAEGQLPGFDELARRAASERASRLGWPAPENPDDAIDDAEFDLAVLDKLVDADPETTIGTANYLLDANDHLGRALRSRARKWLKRWTFADGLVDPEPSSLSALGRHQLSARSYSPTALQHFAACPYRFLLQAIHRLEPREEPDAIEMLEPLTRGSIFAEVQYEILSELRELDALPVTRDNLDDASGLLDERIEEAAARWREKLAPAIERVWDDGIEGIRADLREWLRRAADDPEHWTPEAFELGFGLHDRAQADPRSSPDPVAIEGGLTLRGSIDLIERDPDGRIRVTDHKTGKVRADKHFVIGGGKTLQPVFYALAAEHVLHEPIGVGRLYYCTATGGYQERSVEINDGARKSAREFVAILGDALSRGFLPAAPGDRECDWCDYKRVCGPYEQRRSARKPKPRLDALTRLREMP
ncbi:MAG: PD-(D/E)XK nuclease family protein [Candidatus Binatus sp.]|uniref:PD-(D/E)XK nuclease family protein n=1 Tax=Candidatus Binatus sp. TaxID=2811406 RepID=UPI0027225143|nr:PD-(D/E)XK nuclease family protein [Candidatus Binatus sp.]MDO8433263.1 PD-(D/E)XK nuclease family protein [Candidatus Binatus sp.]